MCDAVVKGRGPPRLDAFGSGVDNALMLTPIEKGVCEEADGPVGSPSGRFVGLAVLVVAALATVSVCALVIGRRLPLGVEGEWTWDYRGPDSVVFDWGLVGVSCLAAGLLVTLFLVGWHVLPHRRRWHVPLLVTALAGAGLVTQASVEQCAMEGLRKFTAS